MAEPAQPQATFALQNVYITDLSFEAPKGPSILSPDWKPQVKLEFNSKNRAITNDTFEVQMNITITVTQDDNTAFLIEVEQGGLFLIRGLDQEQLRRALGAYAPEVLFPYVRETIDNVVLKGGFPPLRLAPMNFEALYQQALEQHAAQQAEQSSAEEATKEGDNAGQ